MNNKSSSGIGIPSLLFIIFLVLKLTKNIDWEWIWVLAPIWMPILAIACIAIIMLVVSICMLLAGYSEAEIKKMFGANDEEKSKND